MILIIKNITTKKETSYPLNKAEDFDVIFDLYPWALNIALGSESIKDAAMKIAKYIDRSSRVTANLSSGVQKTEAVTPDKPREVKLSVGSVDNFSLSLGLWAERRRDAQRGLQRDSGYVADPGRLRDPKLDEQTPLTHMDKVKSKIKEFKA